MNSFKNYIASTFILIVFFSCSFVMAQEKPDMYYMDGYHGGAKAHYRRSSMRDALEVMKEISEWKLSFELETETYEHLKTWDPVSFSEFSELLKDTTPSARVEIVGASYYQPYSWGINGESNIRQLVTGIERIRELFPFYKVKSYAVQEPCWTSCLPQILNSLGYEQACLKNAGTAWTGYFSGVDKEILLWEGPDGSTIPTVPRYASEELAGVGYTEAVWDNPEFIAKCKAKGIDHVLGFYLQDFGWYTVPRLNAEFNIGPNKINFTHRELKSKVQWVTFNEFVNYILPEATYKHKFSQENIHAGLPWGSQPIDNLSGWIRSNENNLLRTEKLASMAYVFNSVAYPAEKITEAWHDAMLTQHHDAYVGTKSESHRDTKGFSRWGWLSSARSWNADRICDEINRVSCLKISQTGQLAHNREQNVTVFNTLAWPRDEVVSVRLACDIGTWDVKVEDMNGNTIPSQFKTIVKYHSERGLNEIILYFKASVPSMGYADFKIIPLKEKKPSTDLLTIVKNDESILTVENNLYRLTFDKKEGGKLASFYYKPLKKEYCKENKDGLNYYKGFYIKEKDWRSSKQSQAEVNIIENGPVSASILVKGNINNSEFNTLYTLYKDNPRVDVTADFQFEEDTQIGSPIEGHRYTQEKAMYVDTMKLQAFFPIDLENYDVYKNAAFDIYKSKLENTFYSQHKDMKMNLLLHWADLYSPTEKIGLSLFTDRLNTYSHGPDYPFSLTMAFGGESGFYNGYLPLKGNKNVKYSIYPHKGDCYEGEVWKRAREYNEQMTTHLHLPNPTLQNNRSLLSFIGESPDVTTVMVKGDDIWVRMFNPTQEDKQYLLNWNSTAKSVQEISPDGYTIFKELGIQKLPEKTNVNIQLKGMGIKTIRLNGVMK